MRNQVSGVEVRKVGAAGERRVNGRGLRLTGDWNEAGGDGGAGTGHTTITTVPPPRSGGQYILNSGKSCDQNLNFSPNYWEVAGRTF